MSEINKHTLLPSIRSKIWLAAVAIVALIFFGVIFSGYLLVTIDGQNAFWAIVPVMLIPPVVVFLGWWLSREITESIAKVAIAAQILERGGFNSPLPNTGARETEEILEKLQRYSQGLQRMSAAMEQVARGELHVSMRPSSTTDRFGLAFQKLLEETSAAIKVKTDLDDLQNSLKSINNEIAGAKYGDLTVGVETTAEGMDPVSGVINHLMRDLRETVSLMRSGSERSQSTAQEIQKTLEAVLECNEQMAGEISDASVTLKQIPKSAGALPKSSAIRPRIFPNLSRRPQRPSSSFRPTWLRWSLSAARSTTPRAVFRE